jgi:Co/Zn/Cd efflux system component
MATLEGTLQPVISPMSASCCVLWFVLAINAAMFLVEIGAALVAGSASLQADALDFLGDAAARRTSR